MVSEITVIMMKCICRRVIRLPLNKQAYTPRILGWCPPENGEAEPMYVNEFLNFTIFLKNFIEFPIFHVKHKNMVDSLQACIFDPKHAKDCPIFTLGYILDQAEKDSEERSLMLNYGAVISVKVDWDCNLDRHIRLCKPEYTFARLDVPFRDKPFSRGFNFRYASHWKYSDTNHRVLTKAYGLRLIIAVSGKAGKFDLITLTLNTGSVVGVFGLATFFCDIILLHLSKRARLYRKHVFETVHLRTRLSSVATHGKDAVEHLETEERTTSRTDVSNGATHRTSVSDGTARHSPKSGRKTVSIRPLTLILSDPIASSARV
jgi:P2X purinoceptor 4